MLIRPLARLRRTCPPQEDFSGLKSFDTPEAHKCRQNPFGFAGLIIYV